MIAQCKDLATEELCDRDLMLKLGVKCLNSMEISHSNGKPIGEINRILRKFHSHWMKDDEGRLYDRPSDEN